MSVLAKSVAVMSAGLKRLAGVSVRYRRGNESIDGLVVVPLATRHDDYGGEEVALTAREKDFAIWAADLVYAGQRWTPQRGDEIDLVEGDVTRTFQVLPRPDDRCYRPSDSDEQQLRVYTVESLPNSE